MMDTTDIMPPLSDDEYARLKASIEEQGILVPVVMDEHGRVIDGHHRLRVAHERKQAGRPLARVPVRIQAGLSEEDAIDLAVRLNVARRHLTVEQRAELATTLRVLGWTLERIADVLGVGRGTVERDVAVFPFGKTETAPERVTGKDGKSYPTTKPRRKATVSAETIEEAEVAVGLFDRLDEVPADVRTVGDLQRAARRQEHEADQHERRALSTRLEGEPGPFSTLVVDPPWPLDVIARDVRPNQVGLAYQTMDLEQLFDYPLVPHMAPQCHVYLWTTQRFLRTSFDLLERWGLTPIFTMVWNKAGGMQPQNLPQYNCEFCVFGRRGGLDFLDTKQFFTSFAAERREHSRKPAYFYDLVRRVSPAPRVDVFGRERHEGFSTLGNEPDRFGGDNEAHELSD